MKMKLNKSDRLIDVFYRLQKSRLSRLEYYFSPTWMRCSSSTIREGGGTLRGVNLPSPYFLSQFLPLP